MLKKLFVTLLFATVVLSCSEDTKEYEVMKTEDGKILVTMWHGLSLNSLTSIISNFNTSQDAIFVSDSFKGSYAETMQAGIAAVRAGNPPNILQVYEVGTGTMSYANDIVYPASDFMEMFYDGEFNKNDYMDAIVSYYSDGDTLLSMPFNSSTPIVYYSKAAFRDVGLDPEVFPTTWEEFDVVAEKLLAGGYEPMTTTYTSWTLFEAFSARHGIPFATYNNGLLNTLDTRIELTDAHKKFFAKMKEFYDKGYYVYYDREYIKSDAAFNSGKVAITLASSASLEGILQNKAIDAKAAFMPYLASEIETPYNTLLGGASIWIFKGHSEENNKATAEFLSYLLSAEVQKKLHKETGYLPISKKAYEELKEEGYYEETPDTEIGILQMSQNTGEYSRGLRLGNFVQIRDIFAEEFEKYLFDEQDLNTFVLNYTERANKQLEDFSASYE